MEENKRKRCANYTDFETDILTELVVKYKDVVENKKTDGVTVKKKLETWKIIENEFNAIPGVRSRDYKHLKVCYENLKRKARKICADEKVNRNKTGGGYFKPPNSKGAENIMALIGPTITPLENPHDSDALYQGDVTEEINFPLEEVIHVGPDVTYQTVDTIGLQTSPANDPQSGSSGTSFSTPDPTKKTPSFPKKKVGLSPRNKIIDSCEKRILVLEQQLEFMKKEHEKEIEIKNLTIAVLKEKLKYWQNMNSKSE
ncbi:myb/SANT-like DNA-binding domain-containing protein 3 [Anabrus simplex]|uniref:myb/SANT-like DNA-binding domain-containing protein 3 n=1 Tax=Anabrus simplex TaxID=316456 RepID=UPI0034DD0D74